MVGLVPLVAHKAFALGEPGDAEGAKRQRFAPEEPMTGMGLGYSIILEASDKVSLCTGTEGTTVVLFLETTEHSYAIPLAQLPDTWLEPTEHT